MFIFNVKVNGNKIFKIFFTIVTILLIFILVFVYINTYKIFSGGSSSAQVLVFSSLNKDILNYEIPNHKHKIYYTNVLKTVHDNIDTYVGKKICFTGYIYRIYDLSDNQFVLARNMIISSDFNYVVGFLCECENAKNFEDGTWVNLTGEIYKGNYHGDMPIIKVIDIKQCDKPITII